MRKGTSNHHTNAFWHFESALLETGWAEDVVIEVDVNGVIVEIQQSSDTTPSSPNLPRTDLSGTVLPGLCNLHSHAHQRAMAGLAERSGKSNDSFWTWRETMYRFLHAMTPAQLHSIAAQLYLEMLQAGYTRVAEFQYLHHQPNGARYDNIAEMSLQTLQAANDVGLGYTGLPVLYQYSGFGKQSPQDQQRRFINNIESFESIFTELSAQPRSNSNLGMAAHSLRAINTTDFSALLNHLPLNDGPIHIHIAEQIKEVDDCISWCGQRPVEYLFSEFDVDERWCLIHATHMTESETSLLAHSGAVAGLCPTTEANLSDGFFNAKDYLSLQGRIGIGSDSHVSVSVVEELRWLEYGQRLTHQRRNVLNKAAESSTGVNLYSLAALGGAQACNHRSGRIAVGQQADWVVLNCNHPQLIGRHESSLIDSWVFSGNQTVVKDVIVAGQHVILDGQHRHQHTINNRFRKTISELQMLA